MDDRDAGSMQELETGLVASAPAMTRSARARVRARVMTGIRSHRSPVALWRRAAIVTASVCVAVGGLSGVGLAAAASLPGEPLHGLELAAERVAIDIAPTFGLQVAARRAVAVHRAEEAARLQASGETTAADEARAAERTALGSLPHLTHGVALPPIAEPTWIAPGLRLRGDVLARLLQHPGASGPGASHASPPAGSGSGKGTAPGTTPKGPSGSSDGHRKSPAAGGSTHGPTETSLGKGHGSARGRASGRH